MNDMRILELLRDILRGQDRIIARLDAQERQLDRIEQEEFYMATDIASLQAELQTAVDEITPISDTEDAAFKALAAKDATIADLVAQLAAAKNLPPAVQDLVSKLTAAAKASSDKNAILAAAVAANSAPGPAVAPGTQPTPTP